MADPAGTVLGPADLIGVVSTGFAVRRRNLGSGLEALSRMGFHVRVGRHAEAARGYLAGTDSQRVEDLSAMLLDPEIRGIWFARGGYGTARILDAIPWRRLRGRSKPLIGYSDMTALFAAVLRRPGWLCFYAPVVAELGDPQAYHRPSLLRLLRGEDDVVRFRASQVIGHGAASGRLVGGNLTVLSHLLGTRFLPSLDGVVLALEDVGEEVYRLDRLLGHLRLAGTLSRVAGVCLGRFDPPTRRTFPPDRVLDDVLRETFEPLGVPVVRDLPFGHVSRKRTLPLGGLAKLDTAARTLRLSPRPVS